MLFIEEKLHNSAVVSYLGQKRVQLNGGQDTQHSHSSGRSQTVDVDATCSSSSPGVEVCSSDMYVDIGLRPRRSRNAAVRYCLIS